MGLQALWFSAIGNIQIVWTGRSVLELGLTTFLILARAVFVLTRASLRRVSRPVNSIGGQQIPSRSYLATTQPAFLMFSLGRECRGICGSGIYKHAWFTVSFRRQNTRASEQARRTG